MRRGLAAAGAALLPVLITAGCGGTSSASSDPRRPVFVKVPPSQVETEITGGSVAQRDLLRAIVAGVGGTIPRATITDAAGWAPREGDVGIRLEGDDDTIWQQHLVAGAFAERSEKAELPDVIAGEVTDDGFALGHDDDAPVPLTPPDRVGTEEADRLNETVAEAAASAGARVRVVRILEPWGAAIHVTLEVDDPAEFLTHRYGEFKRRTQSVWGAFSDGSSIEVVDRAGAQVLHVTQASRVFSTSSFVREDLEGCVSLGGSRPVGWSPPPCPVRR